MSEHAGEVCRQNSRYVVVNEGDDVYVEQCQLCGRVRLEDYSDRPMAWFATPNADWPWRYAYKDPKNDPGPKGPHTFARWTEPMPLGKPPSSRCGNRTSNQ